MITEEQEEFLRKNTFDFTLINKGKGSKKGWIRADIEINQEKVMFEGSIKTCINIINLLKGR